VIPSKKPTAAQIKADKIGNAAYNPVLKKLMGSRPTLEQVPERHSLSFFGTGHNMNLNLFKISYFQYL
jgi:hypothetical protein